MPISVMIREKRELSSARWPTRPVRVGTVAMRHEASPSAYLQAVADDPVLDALDELVRALATNRERIDATIARAATMKRLREEGRTYREIESGEAGPLVVELTRDNLAVLVDAGSRLRKAEARALHAEGMTMEQIAELFGVTRQRVSALLRR
jgi:DNA-directed RNA polymerase specialized sigma24 family protein